MLDIYFAAGRLHPAMDPAGEYLPDQPNALFHNRGDGTFEDVSQLTDSDHTGCARGLAVADVDADGCKSNSWESKAIETESAPV